MIAVTNPPLTLEQRQVIAFIGDYLREYEYLPLGTEVAKGCGFRSSRSADRLMRELECRGVIRRDGRYQRLGTVNLTPAAPVVDRATQLYLAELAIVEIRSLLTTLKNALDFTQESSHATSLYTEGVRRSVLVQAFEATRGHLLGAGVETSADDSEALAEARTILGEFDALSTDWVTFCVCRLVWNLSVLDWARGIEPLDLGYAGSNVVACRKALMSLLPTYRRDASKALGSDLDRMDNLLDEITPLLRRFRHSMTHRFDFEPGRLEVSAHGLVSGVDRLTEKISAV
ncbi:MAG TPA: hypothetical protein VG184_07000 [Acidimicrobiales bacterium]|jgi:hypothetical protein|nr:hypothetical protein [Acidimicrobiales bacterium]